MSTIVYQGLPSFLDTQFNESRTFRLKLSSPKSHIQHSLEMAICNVFDSDFKKNGDELNNLSFIQTLADVTHSMNESRSENVYIHPLMKRASNVLSDKSLEICTENLGSETGTDVIEDENVVFCTRKKHPRKNVSSSRRILSKKSMFPPPLSTMMGSEKVQVRGVRENGRLILRAVKVEPKVSCFQVDRSNGRLRLWFVDVENSLSYDVRAIGQDNTELIEECSESDSELKNV